MGARERLLVALDRKRYRAAVQMHVAGLLVDCGDVLVALQRIGRLARLLEVFQRLVVREDALRIVGRLAQVHERALEVARPA